MLLNLDSLWTFVGMWPGGCKFWSLGSKNLIMAGRDNADVAVRPPVLLGVPLLFGLVLEALWPLGPGLAGGNMRAVAAGLGLVALGTVPFAFAVRRFRAAGTNISTWKPSLALVENGPYRYTRNPIYIGLVTIYFGIAVALTSVWAILFLPTLIGALHKGVVQREEAYLSKVFGDSYRDYQNHAPRWF